MCFSQKLTDKAAGYQEDSGFVLIGYKTVMQIGNVLLPHNSLDHGVMYCLEEADLMMERSYRSDRRQMVGRVIRRTLLDVLQCLFKVEHPIFTPRSLMTVNQYEHPFHVGCSARAAVEDNSANPFGFDMAMDPMKFDPEYNDYKPGTRVKMIPNCEIKRVPRKPGALVRVLVPENAVDATNHVHAMMIIPPGEKETEADIEVCREYNRTHDSILHGNPFAPFSGRAIADWVGRGTPPVWEKTEMDQWEKFRTMAVPSNRGRKCGVVHISPDHTKMKQIPLPDIKSKPVAMGVDFAGGPVASSPNKGQILITTPT